MYKGKDFSIYFIRHAESCGNAGVFYTDKYHEDDPPLSFCGEQQAKNLADSDITDCIGKIYSSTLIRTVQTGYPTAKKLALPIIMLPDLMEMDTKIAGTDCEKLKEKYPLAIPCLSEPSPAGGRLLLGDEDENALSERGKRCIDYFYETANDGDNIMVVSHGSFFGYLIRAALGITFPETFCWQVDNCSITKIIFRKNQIPKLSFANFTGHMNKKPL